MTCYFTKESHIHTLVNLVLLSGLPIANRRIPELDYAVSTGLFSYGATEALLINRDSHILRRSLLIFFGKVIDPLGRFELYERNHGRGKTDKEYSIKISLSEGAHSSNVLDSALDARHSLNVHQRR